MVAVNDPCAGTLRLRKCRSWSSPFPRVTHS